MVDAGIGESYTSPVVCAAIARTAMHRGDVETARRELIGAQRTRSALTYALPHIAVQSRIELARVHLALADVAGARTLVESNEVHGRKRRADGGEPEIPGGLAKSRDL
jgi:LuxR family maltose regulon positive regulatory protein